uniref:Uncharacterized protein n=1 Tax=Proboscia inermis TaxID=420281 RepID=A0A6T8JUE1_9STRA|mmetsp:Transcript_31229/g.31505  ORF Transcript_31229/g.31505 Transcript_31229/m.31505 type:complete len:196 (+) Transcript_31229:120-707(+)
MSVFYSPVLRESSISDIREKGSPEDNDELDGLLRIEAERGEPIPLILLMRLSSSWFREHTKAYKTPTILKKWKDGMPPNVAVWFFHECDIYAIETAYYYDFETSFGERIDKRIIGTCYAYLNLTGESFRHGTWFQGKKIFDSLSYAGKHKCSRAAKMLQTCCNDGTIPSKHAFTIKFCQDIVGQGTLTRDLLPIK